jgi:hypothetical protein
MRHIVALSGGKDSTALAIWMRQQFPGLPLEYATCDTGRELPELYAFLTSLEAILGPIKRLTDGWACRACDKAGTTPDLTKCPHCQGPVIQRDMNYYMDRWATSEDGPYLPSAGSRWCTKHLKIRPFERYIGKEEATVYIGFRADEDRPGNYGDKKNITYLYPFQEAGIELDGVKKILTEAGLKLPEFYKWRGVGGCWNCPFQKAKHWLGLSRNHPDLFAKCVEEESKSSFTYGRRPLPILIRIAEQKEGSLFGEEDDGDGLDGACSICAK